MLIPLAFSLHAVVRGVHVFLDHLTDVRWSFLAVVAVLQVLKIGCAARAWQNSIVAAYPGKRSSFPTVFGALSAGVAVGSGAGVALEASSAATAAWASRERFISCWV